MKNFISSLSLSFAIGLVSLAAQTSLATSSISVTGELSPDLDNSPYLDLTITITGVKNSEKTLGAGEVALKNRLRIFLEKSHNSDPIEHNLGDETENRNASYYWDLEGTDDPTITVTGDDKNDLVYFVRVFENNVSDDNTFKTDLETSSEEIKGVHVGVIYDLKNESGTYESEAEIEKVFIGQNFDVPTEAPNLINASGADERANITWDIRSKVSYTSEKEFAPSGVIALVFINDGSTVIGLDGAAKKASLNDLTDPQGSCSFTPPANDGDQCITCGELNYLEIDSLKTIDGAQFSKQFANGAGAAASVNGLSNDQVYTVALQYVRGTKRSGCYNISPKENFSMSELYGSSKAKRKDARCFIATAAFGSPFNKHVNTFRWFRDEFLLQTNIGKSFVEKYYQLSPPYAKLIAENSFLKTSTLGILYPTVGVLYGLQFIINNIVTTALMLCFLTFGIIYLKQKNANLLAKNQVD